MSWETQGEPAARDSWARKQRHRQVLDLRIELEVSGETLLGHGFDRTGTQQPECQHEESDSPRCAGDHEPLNPLF